MTAGDVTITDAKARNGKLDLYSDCKDTFSIFLNVYIVNRQRSPVVVNDFNVR